MYKTQFYLVLANESKVKMTLIVWFILSMETHFLLAQSFLTPKDTFSNTRFITVATAGTVIYSGTVAGLHEAWYKGFDRTSFHFFNDRGEWNNLDKMGHMFTAYFETELSYRGSRWTGIREKPSIWLATGMGILFQGTIEMFDAYSTEWGFSVYDMLYNLGGTGLFTAQQLVWRDQRIRLKVSSWPRSYGGQSIQAQNTTGESSLKKRTDQLFGTSLAERYLKDYNAQTIWISINPRSFLPKTKLPEWLNLSMGYGSENLFGGFANTWKEQEAIFSLSDRVYPRYRQWFISPDIDFRKIKTNNALLKTAFNVLNIFKIPAPALEYNSRGKWRWHWMFL